MALSRPSVPAWHTSPTEIRFSGSPIQDLSAAMPNTRLPRLRCWRANRVRFGDLEAAAIPVVAVTAWQALFEHARVSRGDTIVVHGAAGSVGSFVVQLAHNAGVRVIATASGRDLGYVRECGANEAIDMAAQCFEDTVRDADAVIDLVGGEVQTRSFAVLRSGGVLVSAVSPPDQALAERQGVRALFFLVDVRTERLVELASMIENGSLRTAIGTVLPLAAARAAHEMLEGRRAKPRGKIVLRVTDAGVA